MGTIHAGAPDSNRYQRMYQALCKGLRTTLELCQECNDMAVHSTIAEMRQAGYPVSKAQFLVKINGRKVYAYYLVMS